jgi:hypothetical protein
MNKVKREYSTLDELLIKFNEVKTWTKEKKDLKNKVIRKIKEDNLYIFIENKNLFRLTKFGQSRKVSNQALSHLRSDNFKAKEIELICMGQEHCDYMYIAAKEIGK